jgi:hypothetical protein
MYVASSELPIVGFVFVKPLITKHNFYSGPREKPDTQRTVVVLLVLCT